MIQKENKNIINFNRMPLSDSMTRLIVKTILTNQLALFYNEKIKYTVFYKQRLKKTLTPAIKELIKIEASEFDSVATSLDEQTTYLQDIQFRFVETIGKLEPYDLDEAAEVIEAFLTSKKSILGLARKINKNKTT